MKTNIIYEDGDVIVVDKPAGLSVHPRVGDDLSGTLISEFIDKIDDPDPNRPGVVHRLDKDTSGIMILAKNTAAKSYLQQQFKRREVKKTYIAITEGVFKQPEAIINVPIARHAKNPLKRAVRAGGKNARSYYRVISENNGHSLVSLKPETGRTHQIRVHLSYVGHPVLGDTLYGARLGKYKRHFLHASEIKLKLPSGQIKTFKSELGKDFSDQLAALNLQMPRR